MPPGVIHQITAIVNTRITEFSTQHFDDDSYRLVDRDYEKVHEQLIPLKQAALRKLKLRLSDVHIPYGDEEYRKAIRNIEKYLSQHEKQPAKELEIPSIDTHGVWKLPNGKFRVTRMCVDGRVELCGDYGSEDYARGAYNDFHMYHDHTKVCPKNAVPFY